jgi:hypothetical protein
MFLAAHYKRPVAGLTERSSYIRFPALTFRLTPVM